MNDPQEMIASQDLQSREESGVPASRRKLTKRQSGWDKFRASLLLILVGVLSPVLLVNLISLQKQMFAMRENIAALKTTNQSLETEVAKLNATFAERNAIGIRARSSQSRLIDYLSQCVSVEDIPQFDTEFIIAAERFHGFHDNRLNLVVPDGNHRLLIQAKEIEGQKVIRTHEVDFELRPKAGFQLVIHTNAHRKESEAPLRLELLSNVADFEPISKTIPVEAMELNYNGHNSGNREFFFPGEVRFQYYASAKEEPEDPSIKVLPPCRFIALREKEKIVELTGYIISDATPCLSPSLVPLYLNMTGKAPKYLGGGKFEWLGKPKQHPRN